MRNAHYPPIEAPVQLDIVPIKVPKKTFSVAIEKAYPDPIVSMRPGIKHTVATMYNPMNKNAPKIGLNSNHPRKAKNYVLM